MGEVADGTPDLMAALKESIATARAKRAATERRPYDSHLRCPHCGKRMMVEAVIRRGEEDLVHVCWACSYEEVS